MIFLLCLLNFFHNPLFHQSDVDSRTEQNVPAYWNFSNRYPYYQRTKIWIPRQENEPPKQRIEAFIMLSINPASTISTELAVPLKQGKRYRIRTKIKADEGFRTPVRPNFFSDLVMGFSEQKTEQAQNLFQVKFPDSLRYVDVFNWIEIDFNYIANGKEQYFFLGTDELGVYERIVKQNKRYRTRIAEGLPLNQLSYFIPFINLEPLPIQLPAYEFYFDFASSELDFNRGRQDTADTHTKALVESIEIYGFTDPVGSIRSNQKLAMKRANAVKKHLQNIGYQNIPIRCIAVGEDATTPPDSARRVEVQFEFSKALFQNDSLLFPQIKYEKSTEVEPIPFEPENAIKSHLVLNDKFIEWGTLAYFKSQVAGLAFEDSSLEFSGFVRPWEKAGRVAGHFGQKHSHQSGGGSKESMLYPTKLLQSFEEDSTFYQKHQIPDNEPATLHYTKIYGYFKYLTEIGGLSRKDPIFNHLLDGYYYKFNNKKYSHLEELLLTGVITQGIKYTIEDQFIRFYYWGCRPVRFKL